MKLRLLAVASLLLTGACGGTAAEGAAPKAGDTLRLALSRQLTNIHPHKGGSPDSQGAVIGSIYESITRISPDFKVVPGLATSWKAVDDLNWEFTVRTDAKYSDGNPLTADDIVWNFQQLLDPKYAGTSGAPLRKYLKSVEKTGNSTLAFHLSQPTLDLPGRLWSIYVVEPSFAQSHKLDTEALGSGPYKLDSLDLENGATLSLNPSYAGPKPAFAKVKYTVLASEAQRIAALKTGEQDIVLNLAPLSQDQFKDSKTYDTILGVGPQPLVLAINERKKDTPLANAGVRQALNYATDKETIIHGLLKDSVKPLPGQVLYAPFNEPNPALKAYPYDLEKAKSLLAAAGFGAGFTINLDVPAGTYVSAESASQAIAAQWAKAGVTLKITTTPFPAWLQRQYGQDDQAADLVYIMWGSQYPGDTTGNFGPFRSDHIQSHVKAPEFDALGDQALTATNEAQRTAFLERATQNYYDAAHTIFLYPSPFTAEVSKAVTWTPKPNRYLYAQEVGRA
ncbi:ABC transporter substrate-binding protein [Dactylosporangium sp. NPDC051541]|uniref:ABC transporter substrate-binding protein n=1 Tax=Dactylosporangium sp. NPDC051541 TaxID=3363977 RepID=UPI0037971359